MGGGATPVCVTSVDDAGDGSRGKRKEGELLRCFFHGERQMFVGKLTIKNFSHNVILEDKRWINFGPTKGFI